MLLSPNSFSNHTPSLSFVSNIKNDERLKCALEPVVIVKAALKKKSVYYANEHNHLLPL